MVEIAIGGGGQFEGPEANIVKGLIIDTECLVRVFNELMNGEGGVVRLFSGEYRSLRTEEKGTSTTVSDIFGLGTTE